MALTAPYRQNHYLGEFATDALTLAFIQAELWDSLGTGLGNPQAGMLYYNTDINKMKFYDGTGWRVLRGDFDFQESVINFYDPTISLPVGPAAGDRYISQATANGWVINWIYEYDGALWMGFQPTEGTTVEVEALNQYWHFNGAAWVLMASVFAHNNLSGIQGGAAAEYYHLAHQDQIYFVGKEGNDASNGLTEGSKFLTFGAAIAAATAAGPGAANIFTIVCFDSGIYNENLTLPSYVSIYAPNATLQGTVVGTLTINSNCSARFRSIVTGASVIGIQKPDVDIGTAYVEADRIDSYSTVGIINLGFANQGVLMLKAKQLYLRAANGFGIGDAVTNWGHTHVDIGDIYIAAANVTALVRVGAGISLVGKVDHILEEPPGHAGSVGINVLSGEVDMMINVIALDTAYTVANGAALRLFIDDLTGAETIDVGGTACVVKACEVNVRNACIVVTDSDTDVAIADGVIPFTVPPSLNGMRLNEDTIVSVYSKGVTNQMTIQIRRRREGVDVDMLQTQITLGDVFHASNGVIDEDNGTVQTGDQIYIDVDAVHTTPAKGVSVTLVFKNA